MTGVKGEVKRREEGSQSTAEEATLEDVHGESGGGRGLERWYSWKH